MSWRKNCINPSETEFSKFGGEEDSAVVRAILTNSEETFAGDKRNLHRVNLCMLEWIFVYIVEIRPLGEGF
jgi:hypothetical protein